MKYMEINNHCISYKIYELSEHIDLLRMLFFRIMHQVKYFAKGLSNLDMKKKEKKEKRKEK